MRQGNSNEKHPTASIAIFSVISYPLLPPLPSTSTLIICLLAGNSPIGLQRIFAMAAPSSSLMIIIITAAAAAAATKQTKKQTKSKLTRRNHHDDEIAFALGWSAARRDLLRLD